MRRSRRKTSSTCFRGRSLLSDHLVWWMMSKRELIGLIFWRVFACEQQSRSRCSREERCAGEPPFNPPRVPRTGVRFCQYFEYIGRRAAGDPAISATGMWAPPVGGLQHEPYKVPSNLRRGTKLVAVRHG